MSNVRSSVVDLPAARFAPKSTLRFVYVAVVELTETFGFPGPPVILNPDVPGSTVRKAVRKKNRLVTVSFRWFVAVSRTVTATRPSSGRTS